MIPVHGIYSTISVLLNQIMTTVRKIVLFFDKLEDKVRAKLSRYPILYAFLGGIGVVLFWRGVWHTADLATLVVAGEEASLAYFLDGPVSLVIGSVILLLTGAFVSSFIGTRLIISGLAGEKKLTEKTAEEIETEEMQIKKLQDSLKEVQEKLEHIDQDIEGKSH